MYRHFRTTVYHQRHKSTDCNQKSFRLPHKTPLLLFCRQTLVLFDISLAGNKNSQQNITAFPQRICCYFDELALQKQTSRGKRLEIRGYFPKYGCKRRNSLVLVKHMFQSFVENMRWIERRIVILRPRRLWGAQSLETDEENSDNDVECLYCSGLHSRNKCDEKWIKRTKHYKWCHEECWGTDDWKTFLCFFCNTE